jgi:hypothetical protein
MRYPDILDAPGIRTSQGLRAEEIATLSGLTIDIARHKIQDLVNNEKLERVPDTLPTRYRFRISGRNLITMPWRSNATA